jgi:hypothetical protein
MSKDPLAAARGIEKQVWETREVSSRVSQVRAFKYYEYDFT